MIWGVGLGRSGTTSLAACLNGLHEPQPWLEPEIDYVDGLMPANIPDLLLKLRQRMQYRVPTVDGKYSYCIPQILKVDPKARFRWVIREPVANVMSLIAQGRVYMSNPSWSFHGDKVYLDKGKSPNHFGRMVLRPTEWPDGITQVGKCFWAWIVANSLILNNTNRSNCRLHLCEYLGVKYNSSSDMRLQVKPLSDLSETDTIIMEDAKRLYEALLARAETCTYEKPSSFTDVRLYWNWEKAQQLQQ